MTESIGQKLKSARLRRDLTLEKVAEATRIRLHYLQALEQDDYSGMPSPIHARGFLRNYAEYLGLNLDEILEEVQKSRKNEEEEVVFEGARVAPVKEPEESPVEAGTPEDSTSSNGSTESLWWKWLGRVVSKAGGKRDAGDTDLVAKSADTENETLEESNTGDLSDIKLAQEATPTVPASQLDPQPAPAVKTETYPEVQPEARESSSLEKSLVSLWGSIADRFKSLRKPKVVELTPDVEEVIPELETDPESDSKPRHSELPDLSSQEIFNEIGRQLRERREMLSLTLDEIERHTRLRAQFLGSLERGAMDELPSPVQTRGMLSNYASFLDLDVDALLLRFADALQVSHRERHPERPARRRGQPIIPENVPPLRSFVAGDLLFGVGMVILLVGFAIWGISRVIMEQSQQAEIEAIATGPSISEALIGTEFVTQEPEVTLIAVEDTPLPALAEGTVEIPTAAPNVNVQVNIVAVERTYLRVVVDGEEVFNGRTIPGNAYPFEAEISIEMLAGNGAALRVVYNQRDLGLMGGFGQLVNVIYTIDEIVTPTPAASRTPTNTVPPTFTPTPTATETPTPTVNPSATLPPEAE